MVYTFERFALDLGRGALLVDGAECALRPKAFALLRHFVENPGRLIDRDEIMRTVWPGIFVTDDSIAQCVRDIRHALGDSRLQLLRTVPRRGYLFAAEVVAADAAVPAAPAAAELADGPASAARPSIAVLPFNNLSGDPEQEYFADGVVEEIITALAHIRWLFVIARNSSFTYKGRAVDVKQVARELAVRYVLEGSVRKAGSRVRITGQLIDTATGAHIWAERFDGALDDIFELQDRVASSVAGAIEPALRLSEIDRAARKPTDSLDAYDLYLRALPLVHRYDEDSLKASVGLLRQALAIDAVYAPAAALLASLQVHLRMQGWQVLSEADMADPLRLARQALAARFEDADTLWQSAVVLWSLGGETATALAILDRALALNPNSASAWSNRGHLCAYDNQPEAAIEAFQRSEQLSPFDPLGFFYANGFAVAHFAARRFEQAIAWADRALLDNRRLVPALRTKIAASAHLGRLDEARTACDQLRALHPGLTIGTLRATFHRGAAAEMIELQIAGLRLAGMPE